jgi:plasmid maintenance system antidote protein VapI
VQTTRFWRSLHQVRSQSKDWRVSGEAFIRYAHNPKTDAFLEKPSSGTLTIQRLTRIWSNLHQIWRLLQKRVSLWIVSVSDEGYSRNASVFGLWAYLMKASPETRQSLDCERTWWRLLQKRVSLWIVSVPDEGFSRNASFALNLRSTLLLGKDIGTINVISCLDKLENIS